MHLPENRSREVEESLSQVGLSVAEQKAYLALLGLGATTATPLAQTMGVPLTTAQSLLKRLAEIGIVYVSKRRSRSVYEAKDPQIFKMLLEQRLQDVVQIIPLLKEFQSEQKRPARIRVYTKDRVSDVFRQALTAKNKLVYEIVAAQDLQEALGERFHFTKRRVEQSIQLKSLRVESREIKKYNQQIHVRELREAKFLPREMTFQSSVMFWDDTVAFLAPASEGLVWMVTSPAFAQMLQQVFALLWSVSRKMETLSE